MDSDAKGAVGAHAKKKRLQGATTVKVVASRYALALQKTREETQERQQARINGRDQIRSSGVSSRNQRGRTSTAPVTTSRSNDAQAQAVRPRTQSASGLASASSGRSAPGITPPAAGIKRHLPDADGHNDVGAGSGDSPMDMKARLEAYRASKQHRTLQEKTLTHPQRGSQLISSAQSLGSKPGSVPTVKESCVEEAATNPATTKTTLKVSNTTRPAFPKRITSASRPVRTPQQSAASKSPPLKSPNVKSPTLKPSTARATKTAHRGPRGIEQADTAKTHYTSQSVDSEELEILQSLYFQLCFVEARSDATFCQQENEAQRQLLGAWELLQTKLRLLHDTTLRLDREHHIVELDAHVTLQAPPVVDAATHLPHTLESLQCVWNASEAALHRMPTPGVTCNPEQLKSQMDALVANADHVLRHLRACQLDTSVSGAVAFENEMKSANEKLSQLMMKLAHMLEELQVEVDSETSVVIQRIQSMRVSTAAKGTLSLTYK